MIDVLQKLKEIAEKKPELVKDAVENVEKTNPKVDSPDDPPRPSWWQNIHVGECNHHHHHQEKV